MAGTRKYSEVTRHKAVLYWFVYRSWGKTARKIGVPVSTIRAWSRQQWWDDMIQEIREKFQKKLDVQYTNIIDRASENLYNRLKNGEERVTAKGDIVTIGICARDLSMILRDIQANRALLRGEPTSRKESVTIEKQLDKVQDFFDKEKPDIKPAKESASDQDTVH